MKLALVGSCQVLGLRLSMLEANPDISVDVWNLTNRQRDNREIYESLSGYDHIITQVSETSHEAELLPSELKKLCNSVLYIPIFAFRGFQPDNLTSPYTLNGNRIGNEGMQSAIVAASFCMGIETRQSAKLFNALVFSSLGYFSMWEIARKVLLENYSQAGFDLSGRLNSWLDTGPFMHTVNHPKIHVLADIAYMAMERLGIECKSKSPPERDALGRLACWPVYPEIADRIGCSGTTTFLGSLPSEGERPSMSLEEFIEKSYQDYCKIGVEKVRGTIPPAMMAAMTDLFAIAQRR